MPDITTDYLAAVTGLMPGDLSCDRALLLRRLREANREHDELESTGVPWGFPIADVVARAVDLLYTYRDLAERALLGVPWSYVDGALDDGKRTALRARLREDGIEPGDVSAGYWRR